MYIWCFKSFFTLASINNHDIRSYMKLRTGFTSSYNLWNFFESKIHVCLNEDKLLQVLRGKTVATSRLDHSSIWKHRNRSRNLLARGVPKGGGGETGDRPLPKFWRRRNPISPLPKIWCNVFFCIISLLCTCMSSFREGKRSEIDHFSSFIFFRYFLWFLLSQPKSSPSQDQS